MATNGGATPRRWPLTMATILCLGLIGCAGASPEQRAREDARQQVDTVYASIMGHPRIWPAEALGRRVVEAGFELLAIDGVESGTDGPGVTMIVRVVGRAVNQGVLGTEHGDVDVPVCFRLRFAKLHVAIEPEVVECPDTPPVTYPPLPSPPPLPERDAVIEALDGVRIDAAAVRAALKALDLDERLRIDVQAGDGAVGVGLRSFGPFNQRHACMLIRVAPDGVEVWHLSPAQDQPGELSCGGREAIVRAGARPPH
jgi:hypothetical protein